MTSKTRSFAGAQDDKGKVILRAVLPPEGSGVVFRGKTKARSFAAAQDDKTEPGLYCVQDFKAKTSPDPSSLRSSG